MMGSVGRHRRALVVTTTAMAALVVAGCGASAPNHGASANVSPTATTASVRHQRAVTWPTASQEIAKAGQVNVPFCGKKQITLAVLDGVGTNPWSLISYAAVKSEAAKCKNVKVITFAASGDLQTAIQQINSAVSQGANAITIIPDFGKAELPAITAATKQGVKVIPWAANPGGKNGVNYVSYVDWNVPFSGLLWGQWMVKALHGHGNVIFTGGPAGNAVGAEQLQGVVQAFKKHPGMHLLTGTNSFAITNWEPATAQQATAALLSRYKHINGLISNYGADALASIRAFKAAGRKLVPIATLMSNGTSCSYKSAHVALATVSGRNWMGRIAARKAIAAAEGLPNREPNQYKLPFIENTMAGLPPKCNSNSKLASDFDVSNQLTPAVIAKYGKP